MKLLVKISVLLGLAFTLAFALNSSASAAPPELDAPAQSAYDKLHETEIFARGGVGFAGVTSESETAFRALSRDENAVSAFVALLDDETATKAGQLYALLGLKQAGSAQFAQRLPAFEADESYVTEMSGCLMMPVKVREIASRFASANTKKA